MVSIADIKYIEPTTLRNWIKSGNDSHFAVIDVRDSDYIGGHIIGCWHIPCQEIEYELPNILAKMKKNDVNHLIFHCAQSQQRGPSSALKFMRYVEYLTNCSTIEPKEKDFIDKITIQVLSGGFIRWQQLYGTDKQLTEDYEKSLWEDY